jgi:hypothetical protein
MRDKDWLTDLGYEREPLRDHSFVVHAIMDLIGIVAVSCFAIALAYMLGAI